MLRFSNILCPVDFDQNSLAAVPYAAELAREHNAALYLLHVVRIHLAAEPALSFAEAEATAQTKLERISHQKLKVGTRYELLVIAGDPADEVLQAASRLGIDLIVMATHGRKGFTPPRSWKCG
jgi:universal stress protein A